MLTHKSGYVNRAGEKKLFFGVLGVDIFIKFSDRGLEDEFEVAAFMVIEAVDDSGGDREVIEDEVDEGIGGNSSKAFTLLSYEFRE